ncbi:radical SAM protein [Photorhabdus bodei]|uniref:Radical SAM protein n=1 Tax=Photorhabdus bodei TaxID=2029681 RepID=A0AAW6BL73_9GAMM|nr:radical SAM protein [Photorhabdus bodei]MDB6373341.1 radical SAM protein [Photorhabdus bodei]
MSDLINIIHTIQPPSSWPPVTRRVRRYRNIGIKTSCNLRCSYCEIKRARVNTEAIINSLTRILERFNPHDVFLRVEADGEITLYPKILDFLAECVQKKDYSIEVLTNGTRLPACLRPGLLWVISIDGHTEQMNKARGLRQKQIDIILDHAVSLSAELQCVYHGQSVEEINDFIDTLQARGFTGSLHFLPLLATKGRPLTVHLNYEQLHKASFLECKAFFDRWDYIYQHGRRGDFVCDQIKNGFNYYIDGENISMVKCDSYSPVPKYLEIEGLQEEQEYDHFPCGTCLSNQEFNNQRDRMTLNK